MLYFRDRGWPEAHRKLGQGANDCGDLFEIGDWVIQAKNTGVMELGRTCTAAAVQARRAGKPRWACIFNRRQHGLEHSYVVMDLRTFTDLIGGARLRQAEVVQPSDGVRSDADPGQCPGESGPRSEAGAHRPRPNQIIACGDQLPR